MLALPVHVRGRFVTWWNSLNALTRDGWLYLVSAGFAIVLGLTSSQGAQWQWGYLTVGPYAFVALLAFVLSRRTLRRQVAVRVVLLVAVVVGAVFVPLGLEAHWRHAQPEVGVITRAGGLLARGKIPTAPTTIMASS